MSGDHECVPYFFFIYIYKLWLKIDDVRETLVGENIGDIV
jgi:hypothetical protein